MFPFKHPCVEDFQSPSSLTGCCGQSLAGDHGFFGQERERRQRGQAGGGLKAQKVSLQGGAS